MKLAWTLCSRGVFYGYAKDALCSRDRKSRTKFKKRFLSLVRTSFNFRHSHTSVSSWRFNIGELCPWYLFETSEIFSECIRKCKLLKLFTKSAGIVKVENLLRTNSYNAELAADQLIN